MKKELKIILVLIISIFLINIDASAATGKGICYGKSLKDGYCDLEPAVAIYESRFPNAPLDLTNGASASPFIYTATIEEKEQKLFCLDPNWPGPDAGGNRFTPYTKARSLNTASDPDKAIIKGYLAYIKEVVTSGGNFAASNENLQIANVAMRAHAYRVGHYTAGGIYDSYIGYYQNIYKQLGGAEVTGIKLKQGTSAYDKAVAYYNAGNSDENLLEFKFNFSVNANDIEDESAAAEPDKFEYIVPIKISGIDKLLIDYDLYKNLGENKPIFYITDINCDNDKLQCEPVEANQYDKNLVEDSPGSEYIVKVKVSGKTSDFKVETNAKILVEYKYYHILDPNNLAELKLDGEALRSQRMIALMQNREQHGDVSISIKTPSMCKIKTEGGTTKYYYGGEEKASALEYMQAGCCNVKPEQLNSEEEKDHYKKHCATEDIVDLSYTCRKETEDKQSISTVDQEAMWWESEDRPGLQKKLEAADDQYGAGAIEYEEFMKALYEMNNNRDDIYMSVAGLPVLTGDPAADTDAYCQLYTSEDLKISLPGVVEATSGRFFVFAENEQPEVEGTIYANFHTNYKRWKKDYLAKIKEEIEAYEAWNYEAANEDALAVLEKEKPPCDSCERKPDGTWKNPNPAISAKPANVGKYYERSGHDLQPNRVIAKKTCNCETGEEKTETSPRAHNPSKLAEDFKREYDVIKGERVELENLKKACEDKRKYWQDESGWKYYLEPDLTFYYNQKYYDTEKDKIVELTSDPIDLVISTESKKYWTNVSDLPDRIALEGGLSEGTPEKESIEIKYGGGEHAVIQVGEEAKFDTTRNYFVAAYANLYYRPTEYYYSLLPNGNYKTNVTENEKENALDIGYVFNVQITNYQNEYTTWFEIANTGHLMQDPSIKPKLKSNVQNSIDKVLAGTEHENRMAEYDEDAMNKLLYNDVCYYNDSEILYRRYCPKCEPVGDDFKPYYITRTVALDNPFPNESLNRPTGKNWEDDKGQSTREDIKNLETMAVTYANENLVAYAPTLTDKDANAASNETINTSDSNLICEDNERLLSSSGGTYAPENLEYSFILTPTNMQETRRYNKAHKYNDFNLKCSDGKECQSQFVEDMAKESNTEALLESTRASGWKIREEDFYSSLLESTRASGWKYYIDSTWKKGTIRELLPDGYPALDAGLTNWP